MSPTPMFHRNVVEFARSLRRAGVAIPPDSVGLALLALQHTGLERRDDVRAALRAVLTTRREQHVLFDVVFDAFWRDPDLLGRARTRLKPPVAPGSRSNRPLPQRLLSALTSAQTPPSPIWQRATLTASGASAAAGLRRADFGTMTPGEFAAALDLVRTLPPPVVPIQLLRKAPSAKGAIDLRRTFQQTLRQPASLSLAFSRRREVLPPLVLLIDVSGSMERYGRVLLHYAHALTSRYPRTETFTLGTQLHRVSACLRNRDVDLALRSVETCVTDWNGGTRLTLCLDRFVRDWAPRVLGGRATLLLATDGLDGDHAADLEVVLARLRRRAHAIVWLNPLLRYDGFEPLAPAVRMLWRCADGMWPMHRVDDMGQLAELFRRRPSTIRPGRFGVHRQLAEGGARTRSGSGTLIQGKY